MTICIYCDHEFNAADADTNRKVLAAHVLACPEHPLCKRIETAGPDRGAPMKDDLDAVVALIRNRLLAPPVGDAITVEARWGHLLLDAMAAERKRAERAEADAERLRKANAQAAASAAGCVSGCVRSGQWEDAELFQAIFVILSAALSPPAPSPEAGA